MVGTDLIGARSGTPADQRKIDRTVVGICAAAVWTKGNAPDAGKGAECRRNIRFDRVVHAWFGGAATTMIGALVGRLM